MLKGDISGSGSLEQIGSGVTVLAGNNSYGGGTTLQSGTLVVGLGDSGGIAGNIVNNASLAFNRADKYSFSGAISGTGAVWQIGEGTTVLSGNSSYSGATGVYDGRLAINGSIATSSLVTVYGGGELGEWQRFHHAYRRGHACARQFHRNADGERRFELHRHIDLCRGGFGI
ncbi:hypothetical protein HED48_18755 [Ochrobactrum intermedium]|nr:hypothetical protein [Brucella intermedia]